MSAESVREKSKKEILRWREGGERQWGEVGVKVIKHQHKHIRTKREQEVGQIATAQLWKNKAQCKKKKTQKEREGHWSWQRAQSKLK